MNADAVILAGGRGTRSANPSIPKIAQEIGGISLLQWHLDALARSTIQRVTLVTGHLSDEVAALAARSDAHGIELTIITETDPRGTAPATLQAIEHSDADRFLVVLGDIWHAFPIDSMLDDWRRSGQSEAAIVHPSLHPQDSDGVIPQPDGSVKVVPKQARGSRERNMSATGIFGVSRHSTDLLAEHQDLGSDVLAASARTGRLYAHISSHYFRDAGTPSRLKSAQADWESGAFARRGSSSPRRVVFLDRDGVINPPLPEVYHPGDMSIQNGVAKAIRSINEQGIPVLVATNQPGIAKGLMSEDDHEQIRAALDDLLIAEGAFVDDYAYCPHHPEAGFPGERAELKVTCQCRKPEAGLLLALANRHGVDLQGSVMVGDTDRDAGAAMGAGTRFIRVSSDLDAATAIHQALEVATC